MKMKLIEVPSLFFWLGADGEIEELTEEEFNEKQRDVRADRDAWVNVTVDEEYKGD